MSCPYCPHCKGQQTGLSQTPSIRPDWTYDLRYLSKHDEPIWGGALNGGEDMMNDANLRLLVERGYAEQIGTEGFVITAKGRTTLVELRF